MNQRKMEIFGVSHVGDEVVLLPTPSWKKRPDCPGLWHCYAGASVFLTQEDLDRCVHAPLLTFAVFGPIPEVPDGIVDQVGEQREGQADGQRDRGVGDLDGEGRGPDGSSGEQQEDVGAADRDNPRAYLFRDY